MYAPVLEVVVSLLQRVHSAAAAASRATLAIVRDPMPHLRFSRWLGACV
jgi:hypothetical protein